MRLASWNVNSLRSRLPLVELFLAQIEPDVVALQETKCNDTQFPWDVFTGAGYEVAHLGTGAHAGVALASRVGLERVKYGFSGEHGPPFDEPRLLRADCEGVRVGSIYVPNGRTAGSSWWKLKLAWLDLLRVELELELEAEPALLVLGDMNVCPTPFDLYQPGKRNRNLVSDEERARIAALLDLGFADLARILHPDEPGYTWFSFSPGQLEAGHGYRLDLALGSKRIEGRATSCRPALEWRDPALRPSDHAPLVVDLEPV